MNNKENNMISEVWMNTCIDTYKRLYGFNESIENDPIPFEVFL